MKELAVHPLTEQQLEVFAEAPPHAILLVGPSGSGKSVLASWLGEAVLGLKPGELENYPYLLRLNGESESIGIEAVRELEHFLSLKVPGKRAVDRLVLIEGSEAMTIEAQNAILKTLEEPPAGTVLIMTARHEQSLLPTITSRLQVVQVRRPDKASLTAYFGSNHPSDKVGQAYMMSGGLPGLMSALLNDTEHPLIQATQRARRLLGESAFERLLQVDELSKDKTATGNLLFILQQMASISLQSAKGAAAKRWKSVLEASYSAAEELDQNGQPKLVLTKLMLSL